MTFQSFHSAESTVSSLLASSGHLHPDPPPTVRYGDRDFHSATTALEAYIADFDRSELNTSTARLQLLKSTVPVRRGLRNKDVLDEQLTERELDFLTLPVGVNCRREADRLSLTTDDLLHLPCDGSLPITRTSAFLSQSASWSGCHPPHSWSSQHQARPSAHTPSVHYHHPALQSNKSLRPHGGNLVSSLNGALFAEHSDWRPGYHGGAVGGNLKSDTSVGAKPRPWSQRRHRHDDLVSALLTETTGPSEATSPRPYPRWMTSQKSEMDFSGVTSVPDVEYPAWLLECGLPADASGEKTTSCQVTQGGHRTPPPCPGPPSWLGDLEASDEEELQKDGGSHLGVGERRGEGLVAGGGALRELRMQFAERLVFAAEKDASMNLDHRFRDEKIEGLILKAEKVLSSPSMCLGVTVGLGCPQQKDVEPDLVSMDPESSWMEDALEAERSWDNPPFTFKSPVPVGGSEDPDTAQEPLRERKQEAAPGSCSSGYSSRKHPGPVEALKQMLFSLQAVEQRVSPEELHSAQTQTTGQADVRNGGSDKQDTGMESEDYDTALGGQSLERALHHLQRLKSLVKDTRDCEDNPEGEEYLGLEFSSKEAQHGIEYSASYSGHGMDPKIPGPTIS